MHKGEIWLIDLLDGKGHEQTGHRPGLIIGKGNGLIIVIPLTKNIERANLPFTEIINCSPQNGLTCDSVALIFQIVSLDETRFIKKMGEITKEKHLAINGILVEMIKIK